MRPVHCRNTASSASSIGRPNIAFTNPVHDIQVGTPFPKGLRIDLRGANHEPQMPESVIESMIVGAVLRADGLVLVFLVTVELR